MGMIDWLCIALGIKPTAFLSGLIGGIFSLRWVPEVGWQGRTTTIFFGGVAANYGTDPLFHYLHIEGLHMGAVGLLIGLFAMSIAAAVFKAVQELQLGDMIAKAARSAINRVTGNTGGAQ